jgi:hypothetical protein
MKKLILLSCIGLAAFSSASFGARTKNIIPSEEKKKTSQKKKNASGKENSKVKKKVNFILPKEEDMYRPEIKKWAKKTYVITKKRKFYNSPESDHFKENVSPELLIQEGRGNGPSPQFLQVKFTCESEKKSKEPNLFLEDEDNVPPFLLTRGTTFYIPNEIPNEEKALKSVFKPLEPNKPQSKLKEKKQK